MSTICTRCGTTFDSKFCPNCGLPALQNNNQNVQQIPSQNSPSQIPHQMPPQMPPLMPQNPYHNNQYGPNRNTVSSKKKHGCFFYGLIILGGIVSLFLFIMFASVFINGFKDGYNDAINSDSTSQGDRMDSSKNNVTESHTQEQYLSEEEVQYLYSNPKEYAGRRVKISGVVFGNPESDENGVYFQMYQQATSYKNNTVVAYYGKIEINDGDYVIIDGVVKDEFKGKNYFGGEISAPAIEADSVLISTYKDVVHPAEKIIEINETQDQYGYEIILEKIEFAKSETRVYLTINNNGSSSFSAYTFNMKIIQNKKQYEYQYSWEDDYPEIQTDLYPNTTTSGIVCFPALSQVDDFILYIDGSSSDWNEDIEEYKFDVKVD